MPPGEAEIHIHSTLSLKAKAGGANFQQITNDELDRIYCCHDAQPGRLLVRVDAWYQPGRETHHTPGKQNPGSDEKGAGMIVEYDNEDRCIRVNGEYVAIREAEGLMDDLTLAIDQWEVDHAAQCDNPDGHDDD